MTSVSSRSRPWRKWLLWGLAIVVGLPGIPFVLVTLGLVVYMYWPLRISEVVLPEIDPSATHVVVLSHGLRDDPTTWTAPLKAKIDARMAGAQVIAFDWSRQAEDTFRCSLDGTRLGTELGRSLAASDALASVHLVAHSCGSFVSLGICEALREAGRDVQIQTTFLDPVTIYGGFFWGYGLDHFGTCADFSDAYIDTGDTVPGSNQALPHAHTFDVTEARERAGYAGSPHVWPTVYYQELLGRGAAPDLRHDRGLAARHPKGVLQNVSDQ